jgi:O-acetyl-ADP-ribose deacetylase (regulator of RNase III)
MATSFTKGDIFETDGLRAYAFGGSLDGTMETGIASAIKKRWPECAEAYAAHCQAGGFGFGDVFQWSAGDVTIFALGIHKPGEKPRLVALHTGMEKLLELAAAAKIARVGLVRIGTGSEGLDWTRVRKMLHEIAVGHPVKLLVFEQFVRARPASQA